MKQTPDPLNELRELVALTDVELARAVMRALNEAYIQGAESWPEDVLTCGMLAVPRGPFHISVPQRSLAPAGGLPAQARVPEAQRPPQS
jgi:hypothetical protein